MANSRIDLAAQPDSAPIVHPGGSMTIDTPSGIERFRMIACLSGLKLESKGMRCSRGVSCLAVARRDYGIKARNAADAHDRLRAVMIARGIIAGD